MKPKLTMGPQWGRPLLPGDNYRLDPIPNTSHLFDVMRGPIWEARIRIDTSGWYCVRGHLSPEANYAIGKLMKEKQ